MSNIIRAWKDETYRQGLSTDEQGVLSANLAGEIELTDAELEAVYGALDIYVPQVVEDHNSIIEPNVTSHNMAQNNRDKTFPSTPVGSLASPLVPVRLF